MGLDWVGTGGLGSLRYATTRGLWDRPTWHKELMGYRASPPFERVYIICVWANPAAPGGLQG